MSFPTLLSGACLAALLAPPATAPRPPAADADKLAVAAAMASVKLGYARFKAGDFERALAEFQHAEPLGDALGDRATIRYMVARSLESLKRPVEAATAFDRALELEHEPARLEKYHTHIAEFEAANFGTANVTCNPNGATFSAGNDPAPHTCPAQLTRILPGPLVIHPVLGTRNFPDVTAQIALGKPTPVDLTYPGALSIAPGDVSGAAYLDGRAIGWVPVAQVFVPPGAHTVEIRSGSDVVWSTSARIVAGGQLRLTAGREVPVEGDGLHGQRSGGSALPWVGLGAGLGALGVGGVFWFFASGEYTRADAAQRRYDGATTPADATRARGQFTSHRETGDRDRWLSFGLLGAGAVVTGVGTYLLLAAPSEAPVTAALGPGGAAIIWRGEF